MSIFDWTNGFRMNHPATSSTSAKADDNIMHALSLVKYGSKMPKTCQALERWYETGCYPLDTQYGTHVDRAYSRSTYDNYEGSVDIANVSVSIYSSPNHFFRYVIKVDDVRIGVVRSNYKNEWFVHTESLDTVVADLINKVADEAESFTRAKEANIAEMLAASDRAYQDSLERIKIKYT